MINRHFFKTLTIFILMIAFGLFGVFLVSYFSEKKDLSPQELPGSVYLYDTGTEVAE